MSFRRTLFLVALALFCACDSETRSQDVDPRAELRRAQLRAFFMPRSPRALVRLGRARLHVWDPEGAEEAFRKAWRLDENWDAAIGNVYFDAARTIASRGPFAVARSPVVARYVQNAVRWSRHPAPRSWYFAQVINVLPRVAPEEREELCRTALRLQDPLLPTELRDDILAAATAASESGEVARWFVWIEAVDRLSDPDARQKLRLATSYALMAKRIAATNPDIARQAAARAQELDGRWANDYELLDLRSRLADDDDGRRLSDMQETANRLIQLVIAATKYSRERSGYPTCESIHLLLAAAQPHAPRLLSSVDAWGRPLQCSVAPYRLYIVISSAGPDGQFDRGRTISAWEAMHITDRLDEADVYIEHGYYAPPWWSQENVLSFYR